MHRQSDHPQWRGSRSPQKRASNDAVGPREGRAALENEMQCGWRCEKMLEGPNHPNVLFQRVGRAPGRVGGLDKVLHAFVGREMQELSQAASPGSPLAKSKSASARADASSFISALGSLVCSARSAAPARAMPTPSRHRQRSVLERSIAAPAHVATQRSGRPTSNGGCGQTTGLCPHLPAFTPG